MSIVALRGSEPQPDVERVVVVSMPPFAIWHEGMLSQLVRLDPAPQRIFMADRMGLVEILWGENEPGEDMYVFGERGEGEESEERAYWVGPPHRIRRIQDLHNPPFESAGLMAVSKLVGGDTHVYLVLGQTLNARKRELLQAWKKTVDHVQQNGSGMASALPHGDFIAAAVPARFLQSEDVRSKLHAAMLNYKVSTRHGQQLLSRGYERTLMAHSAQGEGPTATEAAMSLLIYAGIGLMLSSFFL